MKMTYVEAGYKVAYNTGFRSKLGCMGYATTLFNSHKVRNISIYDVAASIFKSLNNGIDIDNGVDIKTLCKGIKRYQFYRALYAAGPAVF